MNYIDNEIERSMGKLRWFLGEFFVVVAGVLVAFGLNGWYNGLKEEVKERDYVVRIYEDLNSSLTMLDMALTQQRGSVHAGSMLLNATYSDSLPDDERIYSHLFRFMQFSAGTSVSTTLNSLINTGDLQLIQDDSLRHKLGELATSAQAHANNMNSISYSWLVPAYERLSDEVNVADLRFLVMSREQLEMLAADSLQGVPHPDRLVQLNPVDMEELLRRPSFKQAATSFFIAQNNLYVQELRYEEELKKAREMTLRVMERMDIDHDAE